VREKGPLDAPQKSLSYEPFAFRKLPGAGMTTLELSSDALVLSFDSFNGGVGLTRFRR